MLVCFMRHIITFIRLIGCQRPSSVSNELLFLFEKVSGCHWIWSQRVFSFSNEGWRWSVRGRGRSLDCKLLHLDSLLNEFLLVSHIIGLLNIIFKCIPDSIVILMSIQASFVNLKSMSVCPLGLPVGHNSIWVCFSFDGFSDKAHSVGKQECILVEDLIKLAQSLLLKLVGMVESSELRV